MTVMVAAVVVVVVAVVVIAILKIRRNGRRYQHVLALCAVLTGVILKGLTLRKLVFDVCVCMFYVCEVIGFID